MSQSAMTQPSTTAPSHDLVGVGLGPSNLSLAALLEPVTDFHARFFDQRPKFDWHPGLMLPDARLQTSFLKDLVTAADPTSRHSFLAYLVHKKRFYDFVNASFENISRSEFADYLGWVASRVRNASFNTPVREVAFDGARFQVRRNRDTDAAKNLCIATGHRPNLPDWAPAQLDARCFHASEILHRTPDVTGKRVAIVGGGQTGAEVFLTLAREAFGRPASVNWISRRPNFDQLDDSHFADECFTPDYLRLFFRLPEGRKAGIVESQKLKSDGISPSTLREIYHLLYQHRHLSDDDRRLTLSPGREVTGLREGEEVFSLNLHNLMIGEGEAVQADVVILCTGYRTRLPEILQPIIGRMEFDNQGRPRLDESFKVLWEGPSDRRIYMQNTARHSHGIADPQLSLMAWRSAAIVNDLLGRQVYDIEQCPPAINWISESRTEDAGTVAA
ncbi:lysine N(6)-hydroxylase/L-ornithine N(5)-oxygenase family protein [Denitrobaculum tricleocarpae]|uniref:Lysine 6-monooxygenase n=1 Tax=Denitrobaculum tricleocarpae TaxID=2591009 RepID=A0A545TG21_9PROT|nr:SidA/IucD/PvdA family monooxygenase [Denitrobaculum tricleocarpae]TQV76126.1 hypothetical protein FKG95_21005 [Denitrobaculum tricleocarpae]